MDASYKDDSDVINLTKFGNFWRENAELNEYFKKYSPDDERERMAEVMGVPISTIEELESVCSPDTLKIPEYDGTDSSRILVSTDPVPLETVSPACERSYGSGHCCLQGYTAICPHCSVDEERVDCRVVRTCDDVRPQAKHSPDTLKIPEYDGTDSSRILVSTDPVPLETVRNQLEELEERKSTSYKTERCQRMKYRLLDSYLTNVVHKNDDIPDEYRVKPGEIILQLVIYRPKKPHVKRKTRYFADHAFRVLGSRCLTDLRDEIRCPSDLVVPGDFSNTPDLATDICAKDLYKSAFFFIENVFYNDMRSVDAIDYSKPIREWADRQNIASFTTQDMSATFNDLHVQLGVPYVYIHQGDCEHIIMFNELRMAHPTDDLDARNYPQMVMRSARCRTLCHVCQNNTARWLTYNDEMAPESPCYFCDKCFRALHYDDNKQKVCNFEAYKYFHGHVVT